jgi:hypothetical protein
MSRHFRSNVVAYVALFLALGGGAYAATHINGKTIKKHSIPGNRLKKHSVPGSRLKNDSVTGKQVKESSLKTVPRAANANSANTANNSKALGGLGVAAFGSGVVNGGIDSAANGRTFRTPYGVTTAAANGAGLEAIAPVALTLRDFEAQWITNFDGDDSLTIGMQLNDGSSLKTVPLCTIVGNATSFDCKAAGPISIAKGDLYKLDLTGSGLEGNEQATFAYRLAAG